MELKEMIEKAATIVGSQKTLSVKLNEPQQTITDAKNGRRGLKDESCARLAEILGMTYGEVSAARNFAMAKDQNQRDFWLPFVRDLPRKAAAWMIGIATAATMATIAPSDANANDITKRSEKAGEALPALSYESDNVYYVNYLTATCLRLIKASSSQLIKD